MIDKNLIIFPDNELFNDTISFDDTSIELVDKESSAELDDDELFQGDIKLLEGQKEKMFSNDIFGKRTGVINEDEHWPKNVDGKVVVPYAFSSHYSGSEIFFK